MRVLGIDPGTLRCGYAVIECIGVRAPTYVECGVLTAPATHAMEARLAEIARGLREVIDELRPTVVALEDVFANDNVRSALALAQGRGMALAIAGLAALDVHSYPPAVVKKSVVGSGRAAKEQVGRMISQLLGLRSVPRADAADALAIALTHARLHTGPIARLVPSVQRSRR